MKGRTWCISFQDVAKKDGDVQVKYTVIDAGGNKQEIRGVWEGYKKGDTPDKKAERFFNALNSPPYNSLVAVTRAGNTVCFQLKDDAPYQDIAGVEVGDQTGQNFHVYDDPAPDGQTADLETVRFRIEGAPLSSDGVVRLGLGQVDPLAIVPTHIKGKPQHISTVLDALVEAFNAIYSGKGFNARVEKDEVIIPEVPCKLGARGGSDDEGLEYHISMADPDAGAFSRLFDKPRILLDAIRLTNARLDFANIPQLRFAVPDLTAFAPAGGLARARRWAFTVTNTTGRSANDLHVTLAGTGGTLRNPSIIFQPAGCGPARLSITNGNQVNVVWDSACVRPGDEVGILVETDFVPLDIVSVVWTINGTPIREGAGSDLPGSGFVESPRGCGGSPVSFAGKREGTCRVISVDGQAPPAGWRCRCFVQNGITSFSFNGPDFDDLWASGEEGAPLTNPPTFRVTNPATGEVFFVQADCS